MEGKIQYKRNFLFFGVEDAGYGTGQDPSGYAKLEIKEGRGKLTLAVQNLREDPDKITYRAYIIKHEESRTVPVSVGVLPLLKSKAELSWDFNPADVAGTGVPAEAFNVIAILAEYKGRQYERLICPLAAYRGGRVDWRNGTRQALSPSRTGPAVPSAVSATAPQKPAAPSEFFSTVEEKLVHVEKTAVRSPEQEDVTAETEERAAPEEIFSKYEGQLESIYVPAEDTREKETDGNKPEGEETELAEAEVDSSDEAGENDEFGDIAPENDFFGYAEYKDMLEKRQGDPAAMGPGVPETPCGQDATAPCLSQPDNVDPNTCAGCPARQAAGSQPPANTPGDMEKLKESLGKYFESCNPFGSRRGNYRWWKITSPVYLNNILYQCNIKTPLLFNPAVMMAHFKYRHLILGVYNDRVRRREYAVCGVPGVYSLDERPFGEMCRWVQLEGSRPRYGAFGYWLVYIDPKTGKLLKVN